MAAACSNVRFDGLRRQLVLARRGELGERAFADAEHFVAGLEPRDVAADRDHDTGDVETGNGVLGRTQPEGEPRRRRAGRPSGATCPDRGRRHAPAPAPRPPRSRVDRSRRAARRRPCRTRAGRSPASSGRGGGCGAGVRSLAGVVDAAMVSSSSAARPGGPIDSYVVRCGGSTVIVRCKVVKERCFPSARSRAQEADRRRRSRRRPRRRPSPECPSAGSGRCPPPSRWPTPRASSR